ncbi:MAG: hypothetical protein WCG42_05195 [Parachlamydiaceae bacterium]
MIQISLEHNLREIYRGLRYSNEESSVSFPLVANSFGTRIYDSRHWLGRVWTFFYRVNQTISCSTALNKALVKTSDAFHRQFSSVKQHLISYQEYIRKTGEGYPVNEDDYCEARKEITKWNGVAGQFLDIVQRYSPLPLDGIVDLKVLFISPSIKALKECQKIIDMEGVTGNALPLEIFNKILMGKILRSEDSKEMTRWISWLNKIDPEVDPIHRAFEALSIQFKREGESDESRRKNLSTLELHLLERGCRVLLKEDPEHTAWRKGLRKGDKIGTDIILGEEIHSLGYPSDLTHVYSIEGQPTQVAVIGQNCAILSLRDRQMQGCCDLGLKPVHFLKISEDGRIALMEKLQSLNTIKWGSTEAGIFFEDTIVLRGVVNFLKSLIKKNQTPVHFSTSHFMIDHEFQLRSIKPLKSQDFDFNAVEDFILECSSGNLAIFQYLMTESGLIKHPIAKFYLDLIRGSLKGDDISPDDLAGIYKISDSKVVDRGVDLIKQIKIIQQKLYISLKQALVSADPSWLQSQINDAIISCCGGYKTAGTMRETLIDDISKKIICKTSKP